MARKSIIEHEDVPIAPSISVKVAFRMEGYSPLLCEIDLSQNVDKTIKWVADK